MKRLIVVGSIAMVLAPLAWADVPPPATEPALGNDHPCQQIEMACTNAGYVKGEASDDAGKKLFRDCLQPILKGQVLDGVTVEPEIVSACVKKMAKRQAAAH